VPSEKAEWDSLLADASKFLHRKEPNSNLGIFKSGYPDEKEYLELVTKQSKDSEKGKAKEEKGKGKEEK